MRAEVQFLSPAADPGTIPGTAKPQAIEHQWLAVCCQRFTKELFAAAQAKRRTRAATLHQYNGRGADSPYLLTGLLRCGRCGFRMYGHTKHRKKHTYPMYACGGFSQRGRSVCDEVNIHREALEGYMVRRIKERYLESGQWLELMDLVKAEFEALARPDTGELLEHRMSPQPLKLMRALDISIVICHAK